MVSAPVMNVMMAVTGRFNPVKVAMPLTGMMTMSVRIMAFWLVRFIFMS